MMRPKHASIINCIGGLGSVDLTRLRIANILPEAVCRPNVVESVADVPTAARLLVAVKLLSSAGVEETVVWKAVGNARDKLSLKKAIRRTMLMCVAPDHPLEATLAYRPILTPKDLHRAAAKFRNCARGYSVELLDREMPQAFATFTHDREEAIVHLRRRDREWQLEGVFGPGNCRPSDPLRETLEVYLHRCGIQTRPQRITTSEWDALRHFTTASVFDLD